MASRIRRELSRVLPANLGVGIERLGAVRRRIWEEDHAAELAMSGDFEEDDDGEGQTAAFNTLVAPADAEAIRNRRMRWLAQICEYWPLVRLAKLSDADIDAVLKSYSTVSPPTTTLNPDAFGPATSAHQGPPSALTSKRRGLIILAGAGPGHPDLLTTATLKAINVADLVLADKLVPEGVLSLIPRRTPVQIARKFPGNADNAQEELLSVGLDAMNQGKTVLRLKQGDPYLYGRGAEEFDFFRTHGYGDRVIVVPGVTSALSGPVFAGIPPTHRGVADQVLVLTGTGRKGAITESPEYVPSRTCVFLMALHRLSDVVTALIHEPAHLVSAIHPAAAKRKWPRKAPCAIVERASCPDQRVIRSTLEFVCAAVEEEGSRPPGILVVGEVCRILHQNHQRWIVEEGLGSNGSFTELGHITNLEDLEDIRQQGLGSL
ncbi:MAG: hypothetical protein M1821_005155 [Bathelium mastoideum]|nr:MAG: hypothetical protein M1821_005155 [Bathelium mastoideum]KAI9677806.1 MAG: hypothetical protein M1822_008118 [Bathelium mastoideum]